MFSCVERLNISLTYALSRRLSIPATSHQFKPLSSTLHLCLCLFQCISYSHFCPIFCIFKYLHFSFFATRPKAHLLNSRPKPSFYQWGPFKSAKPFCPWRWLRSIGTYESYHKQSQRLHISLPSQKLWIFKQFNFSGNKSSFGRQRNAQNTQHWHLNKLRGRKYS